MEEVFCNKPHELFYLLHEIKISVPGRIPFKHGKFWYMKGALFIFPEAFTDLKYFFKSPG